VNTELPGLDCQERARFSVTVISAKARNIIPTRHAGVCSNRLAHDLFLLAFPREVISGPAHKIPIAHSVENCRGGVFLLSAASALTGRHYP